MSTLSPEAQRLIDDIQNGVNVNVDFANLYRVFNTELDQLIDDMANFELQEDNLKSFKNIKLMYNTSRRNLGEHCVAFGPMFGVLRTDVERYMAPPKRVPNPQEFLDHAIRYLKDRSNGGAPRVVAVAESSTRLARGLLDLLKEIEDLIVALSEDPRYQKQKYRNITLGVTGVHVILSGLIVALTPAFLFSPLMVAHGGKLICLGGVVMAAGAFATYKGFTKDLVDSHVKTAIEDYLKNKLENVEKFKTPVVDHHQEAVQLQEFLDSDFPGGVTEETLASYIQSFDILHSTFLNLDPKPSMIEKVARYLKKREPIINAMAGVATGAATGAATVTTVVVLASCPRPAIQDYSRVQ